MSMDSEHQVLRRSFQLHCSNGFRDELGRLRSDDMNAQNLSMLRVGNNLYKAVVLAHDGSTRVGGEGKLAHFEFVAGFSGFSFGQADAADFGMAVGSVGNAI